MDAIILAGGLGTRLRSVVSDVPKPMAPVRGRPFLEHLMAYWIAQGVGRFVLSVCYMADVIRGHFGDSFQGVPVAYAEEGEPMGTGGGLFIAAKRQGGENPSLIMNGDTFLDVRLAALDERTLTAGAALTLALRPIAVNDRYGSVELDPDGRVVRFVSEATGGAALINGGTYLATAPILALLAARAGERASLEADVFPEMLRRGYVLAGEVVSGKFVDIGIADDYNAAASILCT